MWYNSSYQNANTRQALDMLPRVLTVGKASSKMANPNIPHSRQHTKPQTSLRVIVDGMLPCTKCKELKPATSEFFTPRKTASTGFESWCKACKKATPKKPYIPSPEVLIRRRERSSSPETKAYRKKYDQEHYRNDEYRAKNAAAARTPERKAKREEYLSRPEVKERRQLQRREYGKQYRQTTAYKESQQRLREKRKTDPDHKARIKVAYQKRQARKLELPDTLTTEQWQFALGYFNGCCAVCGRPLKDLFGTHTVSIDHWIPLSSPDCLGTTADNCIPLCHGFDGCNGSKNYRDPVEWLNGKFGKRKAKRILERISAYFEIVRDREADCNLQSDI